MCAQAALADGEQKLTLATVGYRLAGGDALEAGFVYKAALAYGKAAVLEHTLRRQKDTGLSSAGGVGAIGSPDLRITVPAGSAPSSVIDSNEAKAFIAFQQIGDYVAMANLRKNLGATARSRFPELTDVEKVRRYNFHDPAAWADVSTPDDFGAIEKTLNSGNVLRFQFDTDLQGDARTDLASAPLPDKEDLKTYGNAFARLIDLSPTFRSYFYSLLERQATPVYTVRVNIEQNSKYAGYTSIGGTTQTIFPYPVATTDAAGHLHAIQKTFVHEFAHDVQPGFTKDSDGTTVMRADLGSSHDRQQTAFMGGVINEYNHFLALAYQEVNDIAADAFGTPIRVNIDRDDYCEDLILTQPEWKAAKASDYLKQTAAALEQNTADEAFKVFSNIDTAEQIDIRMYDAQFGRNVTHSRIDRYNVAELSLQQLLVEVDRVDWFAADDTVDNTKTRQTMGQFLNLLVEQGKTDVNNQDWRTTINGAFNYLSMNPRLEIPGYAYAGEFADPVSTKSADASKTAGGNGGTPASLVSVMTLMSIVIAGLGLHIARKAHAAARGLPMAGPGAAATAGTPEPVELPV